MHYHPTNRPAYVELLIEKIEQENHMSKLLDVMTAPWAITSTMLQEIGGIYLTHLRGDKIDLSGVEAKLGHPLNNEKRAG